MENAFLNPILAYMGDGVIATDIHGNINFMNAAAEQLTGWKFTEANRLNIDSVFKIKHADTNEILESPVFNALAQGTSIGLQNRTVLIKRNEDQGFVSASCSPVKDANGTILGTVIVIREITRIKQMEEDLRLEKDNLSKIFESLPKGMCIIDDECIVRQVNPIFLKMVRMNSESTLNKMLGEALHCANSIECGCGSSAECENCQIRKLVKQVFETAEADTINETQLTLLIDGQLISLWYSINAVPVSISGRFCVMVVIDDITEHKLLQMNLAESRDMYISMFDNFPAFVWRSDTYMRVDYYNKGWLEYRGTTGNCVPSFLKCIVSKKTPSDPACFI